MLYSLVFGLWVPLKPGIVDVAPRNISEGERLQLEYKAYNVDYSQIADTADVEVWLKIDEERILKAKELFLSADNKGIAQFDIPNLNFNDQEILAASLIISDPVHGYALLPSAIFIKPNEQLEAKETKDEQFSDLSAVHEVEGIRFPYRSILHETIRNTYYHVPLWFAMVILFGISAFYSVRYLRSRQISYDKRAAAFSEVGILFGLLGFFTGAVWAKFTWGAFWSWDIKQFTSAVALLIYMAYFILRSSVSAHDKRARFTASYNVFAFIMLIPLLFIVPRMTDSLHPGSGGNPAMGGEDLDNTMRLVFYPAVIGWILLGYWISSLKSRINKLKYENETAI